MPNNTTNSLQSTTLSEDEINNLISNEHYDKLIEYSPYLAIKLINENRINPDKLSYEDYINLINLSQDVIALKNIGNIVTHVEGSLNEEQKHNIREQLVTRKKNVIDSFEIIKTVLAGVASNHPEAGQKQPVDEVPNPNNVLNELLSELCLRPPNKLFFNLCNKQGRKKYLKDEFKSNAALFVNAVASDITLGHLTPNLSILEAAFQFNEGDDNTHQARAIKTITGYSRPGCQRGRILDLKTAIPNLAKILWENETCQEELLAVLLGEKNIDGVDNVKGTLREFITVEARVKLEEREKESRKRSGPPPTPRPSRLFSVAGHTHFNNGGHGL